MPTADRSPVPARALLSQTPTMHANLPPLRNVAAGNSHAKTSCSCGSNCREQAEAQPSLELLDILVPRLNSAAAHILNPSYLAALETRSNTASGQT